MPEEFVRKEVYEANLKRIETVMEKTLIEMKADNEKLRSEVKADMEKLRSEVKADIEKLRGEFNGLRGEFNGLRGEFNVLRSDMQTALARYESIALETRGEVHALTAHIQSLEYWGAIIIGAATIAFGLAQFFQSRRESIAAKVREEVNELRKTVLMLVDAGKIAAPR